MPDVFVVAHATTADRRLLRLADVIIQPPQPDPNAADELATRTLHEFPGCALVAVPFAATRILVRYRGGEPLIVPADGLPAALLGYLSLTVNRSNRVAASAALGSPQAEKSRYASAT
jgi:hypothetical protein